jgi:hypothetical protein
MTEDEVRAAVAALVDQKEEINSLEDFFSEQHPEEWARLRELHRGLEAKQEEAKIALRTVGTTTSILGFKFGVKKIVKKEVDTSGMVEKAKDRGDLYTLLEYGVLSYTSAADQIERLPDILKAIYSGFVTEKQGTSQVSIPADLK